ncbi:MAG: hypothetical protein HFG41_09255 [Coprococcus sp.]|nr:hypothetical protein [Coprococcus sp.]
MEKNKRMLVRFVRYGILTVSILFIVIGIMKQEYLEVLQKAVKICLECIGIG